MSGIISVIIPIYNVEKYLSQCLDSIVNQTYSKLDIILVYNESMDGTKDICKTFREKDSRIRILTKEPGCPGDARNMGLDAAKGEYVTFVDADDWMDVNCLATMASLAKESCADIVASDPIFDFDGKIKEWDNHALKDDITMLKSEDFFRILLKKDGMIGSPWVMWGKLYKLGLFEGIRSEKGRWSEDLAILPQVFSRAKVIVYDRRRYYHYIQHEGSYILTPTEAKVWDNYIYLKNLQTLVEESYPALKAEMYTDVIDTVFFLYFKKQCNEQTFQIEAYQDLKRYAKYYLKSNKPIKFKLILILTLIFPERMKKRYEKRNG